jgi:hypothetical protein
MQMDIVFVAVGVGAFLLLCGLLVVLDERVLDRRR